jgi:hypothetical protein
MKTNKAMLLQVLGHFSSSWFDIAKVASSFVVIITITQLGDDRNLTRITGEFVG